MKDPLPQDMVAPTYLKSKVAKGVSSWEQNEMEDFCPGNRFGQPIYDAFCYDIIDTTGSQDVGFRIVRNL